MSLGFKEEQIDVIGCPSLYLNGRGFRIDKRIEANNIERIAYSFTPGLYKHIKFVKAFKDFISQFQEKIYIAQRRDELATMLLCRSNPTLAPHDDLLLNKVDHKLIMNDQARFFTDFNSWIKFCQKFDFSLGTRLHGTVASILAGVPSLLLAHDSRTVELAEFHGIPYVSVISIGDVKDIVDRISHLDYNNFNNRMTSNFDNFCKFLSKNGLKLPKNPNYGVDERLAIREIRPLVSLNKLEMIQILSKQSKTDREYVERLKKKLNR